MRLLFITRKYPPMIGGMEKVSYDFAKYISQNIDTTVISWGGSQKFIPIIIPYFFLKALFIIPAKKIDHIHLGDSLLSPLGLLLKSIFRTKVSVTVHGLDITFKFAPYQFIIPRCINKLDKIVCISKATLIQCISRGIDKTRITVIPWGIKAQEFTTNSSKKDLEFLTGMTMSNKKVIITVGRLVKRKGVSWFIKDVMPRLPKKYIYLVIGEGPEHQTIERLIKNTTLNHRIYLMGRVDNETLKKVYNASDVFVMPNIPVRDDIEGFGIVAIEASSTGLPVVASDIDGINGSIINHKTGILVKPKHADQFVSSIIKASNFSRNEVSLQTLQNYSWTRIVDEYIKAIE